MPITTTSFDRNFERIKHSVRIVEAILPCQVLGALLALCSTQQSMVGQKNSKFIFTVRLYVGTALPKGNLAIIFSLSRTKMYPRGVIRYT